MTLSLQIWIAVGSGMWILLLLLPFRPWSTAESLNAEDGADSNTQGLTSETELSEVTVLTPARDEEAVIAETMSALNHQGKNLSIILIDDQSSDRTAALARETSRQNLRVLTGSSLPSGWAGKLWALEQGRKEVRTPYILLLDADIGLAPGLIPTLLKKMQREDLDFVSLMAHLRMKTFWEKLLVPAFIYFFKLLYPFALSNRPRFPIAAGAGGCILLKTNALEKIGGFGALKGALIDDCSLAKKMKQSGFRTWIGLTHSAKSLRDYPDLASLWNMVARTAFTQLRYSNLLLLLTTVTMLTFFWAPIFGMLATSSENAAIYRLAVSGAIAMALSYLPTIIYYQLSPLWVLTMPIIGSMFLAMTWTSAIRYWRGRRSEWKGRIYQTETKEDAAA